jgi:hypothetical protein
MTRCQWVLPSGRTCRRYGTMRPEGRYCLSHWRKVRELARMAPGEIQENTWPS